MPTGPVDDNSGSVEHEGRVATDIVEQMKKDNQLPPAESYFMWKEYAFEPDGSGKMRLFTPWANPMEYEYPADLLFTTREKAIEWKNENAMDETWVLVEETTKPLEIFVGHLCDCGATCTEDCECGEEEDEDDESADSD